MSAAAAPPPPITYNIADLTAEDFFGYSPSLALAIIALVLFFIAAVIVGVQTHRSKNKNGRHMHLVTTTGLTEAGGYAALCWLIQNSGDTNIYGSYVAMQVLVVLSPNLLQAANYATVGKIVRLKNLHGSKWWLRPFVITVGFVVADVLALCIQAIGIALWASSKGSGEPDQSVISLGSWITVAGLAVQLFSFLIFTILAVWVQKRHSEHTSLECGRWHQKTFVGIYATITLVTIRNIYRFVEFIQGAILTWPYGEDTFVISESQVLFYTLDTLPILLCFVFYIWFNPATLLPKPEEVPEPSVGDVEKASGGVSGNINSSAASVDTGKGVATDNSSKL